jgi:hypothetical protein
VHDRGGQEQFAVGDEELLDGIGTERFEGSADVPCPDVVGVPQLHRWYLARAARFAAAGAAGEVRGG